MENPRPVKELVELLRSEFDEVPPSFEQDIHGFLKELADRDLILFDS